MTDRSSKDKRGRKPDAAARAERLRAALRANLQRRKRQARARAEQATDDDKGDTGGDDS